MEAAHKRAGHGNLDLSEEFFNYFQKMFSYRFLPQDDIEPIHAENNLGPSDGGDARDNLRTLVTNRLRLPLETAMPYRPNRYDRIPGWSPWIAERPFDAEREWSLPFYTNQFNADSVNLNPGLLPRSALSATNSFYGINSYKIINPNSTDAIEAELAAGREVIIDVGLRGICENDRIWTGEPLVQRETRTRGAGDTDALTGTVVDIQEVRDSGPEGRIYVRGLDWTRSGNSIRWLRSGWFLARRPATGATYSIVYTYHNGVPAHSMLIVGYDRRIATNAIFIVKNSWGPTTLPGAGGFQYVTYDFIRNNAYGASCITSIAGPASWLELQFLGRWNLEFDGWRGTLDIHHLPGRGKLSLVNRGDRSNDSRVGTFFDTAGNAFRVNGYISGNDITFSIDSSNPNPLFTEFGGRRFVYHLFRSGADYEMAGFHRDPDGRSYAGYARKDNSFISGVLVSGPVRVTSYLGRWNLNVDGVTGTMNILWRDDSGVGAGWTGFYGTVTYGAAVPKVVKLKVSTATPSVIELRVPRPGAGDSFLNGKMESWNPGVIAGEGTDPWWVPIGFYAHRTGY